MPVTKKKGTLFAIYADTPEKPTSTSSSSSTISTNIKNVPKSPSKTARPRKALSSLQPKAIEKTLTFTSKSKLSSEDGTFKPQSKLVYEDEPSSKSKTTGDLTLKSKSRIQSQSQSQTSSKDQLIKSRTISSITIFSDENATPPTGLNPISSSSSSSLVKEKKVQSTTTLKPNTSSTAPSSPKTRRSAPKPLIPVFTQPTKRSRDLLSPLPITNPTLPSTSTSAVRSSKIEIRRDDPSESPAKRNRTTTNDVTSTSTPIRGTNRSNRNLNDLEDKENVPPSSLFSPESVNDSPATRTRSKIRALTISSSNAAQSPLRGSGSRSRVSKVERLVGDGRGTLTLKKGRELASLIDLDDENLDNATRLLVKDSTSIGNGIEKKSFGKSSRMIGDIQMLGDVSEAYGAEGDEPEGFKTQRR